MSDNKIKTPEPAEPKAPAKRSRVWSVFIRILALLGIVFAGERLWALGMSAPWKQRTKTVAGLEDKLAEAVASGEEPPSAFATTPAFSDEPFGVEIPATEQQLTDVPATSLSEPVVVSPDGTTITQDGQFYTDSAQEGMLEPAGTTQSPIAAEPMKEPAGQFLSSQTRDKMDAIEDKPYRRPKPRSFGNRLMDMTGLNATAPPTDTATAEFESEQLRFQTQIQSLKQRILQLENRLKQRATRRDQIIQQKRRQNAATKTPQPGFQPADVSRSQPPRQPDLGSLRNARVEPPNQQLLGPNTPREEPISSEPRDKPSPAASQPVGRESSPGELEDIEVDHDHRNEPPRSIEFDRSRRRNSQTNEKPPAEISAPRASEPTRPRPPAPDELRSPFEPEPKSQDPVNPFQDQLLNDAFGEFTNPTPSPENWDQPGFRTSAPMTDVLTSRFDLLRDRIAKLSSQPNLTAAQLPMLDGLRQELLLVGDQLLSQHAILEQQVKQNQKQQDSLNKALEQLQQSGLPVNTTPVANMILTVGNYQQELKQQLKLLARYELISTGDVICNKKISVTFKDETAKDVIAWFEAEGKVKFDSRTPLPTGPVSFEIQETAYPVALNMVLESMNLRHFRERDASGLKFVIIGSTPVTQELSRVTTEPKTTQSKNNYGHARDYSWLRGILSPDSDGRLWLITYDLKGNDKYSGNLGLTRKPEGYRPGEIIEVRGRITTEAVSPLGKPLYKVDSIKRIERLRSGSTGPSAPATIKGNGDWEEFGAKSDNAPVSLSSEHEGRTEDD
jgi:hypothetical protein